MVRVLTHVPRPKWASETTIKFRVRCSLQSYNVWTVAFELYSIRFKCLHSFFLDLQIKLRYIAAILFVSIQDDARVFLRGLISPIIFLTKTPSKVEVEKKIAILMETPYYG